jgi:hypothetical protein
MPAQKHLWSWASIGGDFQPSQGPTTSRGGEFDGRKLPTVAAGAALKPDLRRYV